MNKVILGIAWVFLCSSATAVQVRLVQHSSTSFDRDVIAVISDGSHISGIVADSTAAWDWDGTTLSSAGVFNAVWSLGGSPLTATILADSFTDLSIDTSTATATATEYACIEGSFLSGVGASGCAGLSFGANYIDESTTVWGPGTAVSQTVGGDDTNSGSGVRTIAAYDFGLIGVTGSGLDPGDLIMIGNSIPLGTRGGRAMTFEVSQIATIPIPASVWLFGSALGLVGLARRRSARRTNRA